MADTFLFVGGGTMGHLAPLLAVAEEFQTTNYSIHFVCGMTSIEKSVLEEAKVSFSVLSTPKFPRGASFGWITFPFHFFFALISSFRIIQRVKPVLIFSKGGFISVPIALVAYWKKIPIALHESDAVTGMGNRLITKRAKKICHGFPMQSGSSKDIYTGNPVRAVVRKKVNGQGLMLTGFSGKRPIIMIIGGSQGAASINDFVSEHIDSLLSLGDIIHITGKGKSGAETDHARYFVREYVKEELPALYAIASVVVTRAGAGTLSELAYFQQSAVIIPIEGLANNHQVENALTLEKAHAAVVLRQEQIDQLPKTLEKLLQNEEEMKTLGSQLHIFFPEDASKRIADVLLATFQERR